MLFRSRGGHHLFHYQGCAPHAPLSWSHSTRSWMPMEYSHALCRGRGPALCSWIAVRSCRCSVTQHEIMSTLTLCSVFGSVTCGLVHLHSTLGVMRRSTEASIQGHLSERRRLRHQERSGPVHRGRLSLQPAPVYSKMSGTASCCGRPPAGGPGLHSSVRSGSLRLCQPSTPSPISCRGIHMDHVWVRLDKRGE